MNKEDKLLSICKIPPSEWKVEKIDFNDPKVKKSIKKCHEEQEKIMNRPRLRFR